MNVPNLPEPIPTVRDLRRVEPPPVDASLIRLNRNERSQALPDWFVDEVRNEIASAMLTNYPSTVELHNELAAALGVDPSSLLLTAGSDSAVKALYQTYVRPGDSNVALDPSYAMYRIYAKMYGATVRSVPFDRTPAVDPQALLDAVGPGTRLIFVANPNQPTGTLFDHDVIEEVAQRAAEIGALAVVDECYFPFSHSTVVPLTAAHPNLVVLRTFSKAAGLAGARIGFVVAHPAVIANLEKVRSVADINAFSIICARLVVAHHEVVDDFVAAVEAGKSALEPRLRALGLEPLPTHANFQLVRVGSEQEPEKIAAGLAEEGYLVKSFPESPSLGDCIRVTLGPPELMLAFADALDRVVGRM